VDPSARLAAVGAVAAMTSDTMPPACAAAASSHGASAAGRKYRFRAPAAYSPAPAHAAA